MLFSVFGKARRNPEVAGSISWQKIKTSFVKRNATNFYFGVWKGFNGMFRKENNSDQCLGDHRGNKTKTGSITTGSNTIW
ncbi:MAG: hypothetical protein HOP10_03355 [Chitinophagaceae bacterium]|nr:hypothetical protein [Chitinophagaceae bacterium]